MPTILLNTFINAPVDLVFDLARSIDLHMKSTSNTNEVAIAGRTTGLIELDETVTWRAKHFGIYQNLTVEVISLEKPIIFQDVMTKGAFKNMSHTHKFVKKGEGTLMIDEFVFNSPFGLIGKLADYVFLKRYMTNFLINKNKELKSAAESDNWKSILKQNED